MIDWPSTGIAIQVLKRGFGRLDLARLEEKHGRAFLLRHGAYAAEPLAPMRTRSRPGVEADATGDSFITVLPVLRRPTNEHPFVAVGRLVGNDIAFFDETISKFHAYLKEGLDGVFSIQDARSRNGTSVDEIPVAKRGDGPPVELKSGQTVRFGSVTTTFLDSKSLLTLLTRLG